MTKPLALAGKGGTGKTTIAGLLISALIEHRRGPVLAIDADPASNLNTVLDLPLGATFGWANLLEVVGLDELFQQNYPEANEEAIMRSGEAKMLSYGITDDMAWSVGLPCGGEIDVFVEPVE